MDWLRGDVAELFGQVMGSYFLDATLYGQENVYDSGGELTILETEFDCLAQVDACSEAQRGEQGYADTDRRIFILSTSTNAVINTDMEIIVNEGPYAGVRFQVASVISDPALSYSDLRGARAG